MRQLEKPNVLVVDDHHENLVALEAILEGMEINIVKANSGASALWCLLNREFALILLDVEMPEMDGFQTAEFIRQRRRTQLIPIIFVTAINKSDQQVFRGYSVGAVDYLFKPFAPEVLRSKVGVFVDLFKANRELAQHAERLLESNLQLEETNQKVAGLNREISRQSAELKAERDFVSTILDTVGCLVAVLTADGKIVLFNRACEELTAHEFEGVKGYSFLETCLADEAHDEARRELGRVLATGRSKEMESEWIANGGERHLVSWHYTTLPSNSQPEFVIVAGNDVTMRKRAEEARIYEQSARMAAEAAQQRSTLLAEVSTLLASPLDGSEPLSKLIHFVTPGLGEWSVVYSKQPNGHFVATEVSHSDPAKEGLVRRLLMNSLNIPEEGHWLLGAQNGRAALIAQVIDSDLEAISTHAEVRDIWRELGAESLMLVPLVSLDSVAFIIAFVGTSPRRFRAADLSLAEEIGRRAGLAMDNARLFREAQEANRAKDEFLATVSHELRTPLNAILGWTRLLREEALDKATISRALETIERNGRAQAQLIEDILDASRIISGKLRLDLEPVEIADIIRGAMEAARPAADSKGIVLHGDLNGTVAKILGDAVRLQQIVGNLLSNAIKFTPKGGQIHLTAERSGSTVQFSVADTGKGITPEFLPKVFDRFSQAVQTSNRNHGGLGLGLAIVRNLVELHGGSIDVESPGEGLGATFHVRLPVPALTSTVGQGDSGSWMALTSRLEGLRVLVVDDEPDAREMLSRMLEGYGVLTESASSAREALSRIEACPPDVLVSDIGMPGEDGYWLLMHLRTLDPAQGGSIPAVALTAYANAEDRARALACGYKFHLPKPADPVQLARAIAIAAGRAGKASKA